MSDRTVFDTPLQLAREGPGPVVVVYEPDGRRIAFTAAAAMLSARELARAARAASRRQSPAVLRGSFDRFRHPLRRRWQAWRAGLRLQPLRATLALTLLPALALMVSAVLAPFAFLPAGDVPPLLLGALVPVVGLAFALPLAWLAAARLIGQQRSETRAPPGSRPRLAVSNE